MKFYKYIGLGFGIMSVLWFLSDNFIGTLGCVLMMILCLIVYGLIKEG